MSLGPVNIIFRRVRTFSFADISDEFHMYYCFSLILLGVFYLIFRF